MRNFFLTAILLLSSAMLSRAASAGDEVIVIYNTRVAESKGVADHYAELRQVPASQIFGFALSTNEEISRAEFRDSLQKPLAKLLEEKKLWYIGSDISSPTNGKPGKVIWRVKESKIRYAVLCYGVPVRIGNDSTLKEDVAESVRPELRRNNAAVDSELALLPCIEQNLPLTGPLGNPYYTTTNAALFHPTNGILLVARLDGPSAGIARGLVDKAIQAEADGLWGRGYFDMRGLTDTNYIKGDEWILGAAKICQLLAGYETIIDTNGATFPPEFPMSHIAIYCGWYDENASGPFAQKNVEFMPGAFAYHLHSFSAATVRSTTNRWVGPLLAKGTTATMGCVEEPYLDGTPDVAVFCARWILSGFTFGEAAYASQRALSWQTTVIGDPLYRPFGKLPQRLLVEQQRAHSKLIEWSYLRIVNMNLNQGRRPVELTAFLEQLPDTKTSAVLTEKLADLYAALGKPASATENYEKALALDPSPMQRLRLRLTLADKLTERDQTKDASDDLKKLLAENPDYPNKPAIQRRLLDLATKLGDKDDIERYTKELNTPLTATH
jgi:uncharacterized protein (TIGR03790 family)